MIDFKLNPTFPELDIPDFERLSKNKSWDPKLYSPIVYNERIKKLSKTLKPGTLDYDDFWDEMDYYCIHGFKPKGMPRIAGRHFYYLNFCQIMLLPPGKKTKVLSNPFYRDLDHWMFLEYEAAEKHGYGLLISKPRQVGLSEFGVVNVNYNMKFFYHSEASIAAGKEDKVLEFKQKLKKSLDNTHPAYKCKIETNNDELMEFYYNDVINKQKIPSGPQTKARFKTMFADTGAFEGINNCKIAIFEEMGLFENAPMSFKATTPSFRSGAIQFGVPLCYGTGGEIDKGAKGYKEMWDNHTAYNLKRIFIPAYVFYPGDGIADEETGKVVSFFNYNTGVTNRALAKKYIIEERQKASRSKDTYIKHIQSYPLIPSEVFLKTKGGVLNLAALNFQLKEITEGKSFFPVLRGRLKWIDTEDVSRLLQRAKNTKERTKIRVKHNCKVVFVEDENGPCITQGNPINQNITHLSYKVDIGACDSYDEEVDEDKKDKNEVSSGCIMAYRCFSGPSREFNYPVGVLVQRGDGSFDDDVFYENAVMFAIYWDIEILFEYTKFHIMRYFYDVGADAYVKARPIIDEINTGKHGNKDGLKMTPIVKTVGTKLLKSEVKENIHKYFIQEIILDMIKFGEENTDIAMTLLLCLIHRMDIFDEVTDGIEIDTKSYQNTNTGGSSYYVDIDGNLRLNSYGYSNEIEIFNPERDLSEYEYNLYMEEKNKRAVEIVKRKEKYEDEAKTLGVDPKILELVMEERRNLLQ